MSLNGRPDLGQLKKQAKELLRSAQASDPDALARFAAQSIPPDALHHAQWVIAREQGFASWAKLKEAVESYAATLDEAKAKILERAWLDAFGPDRSSTLRRLIADFPAALTGDPWMAALCGDVEAVRQTLDRDPEWANRKGGGLNREPLLYACLSWFYRERPTQIEAVVKMLLEAGADPNAYYVYPGNETWKLPALYGAAGVLHSVPLTRILLKAGADPNDGESCYHAAEGAGVGTLEPLFEHELTPFSKMHALFRKLDFEDPESVRWLMGKGLSPNMMWDAERDPALHRAVRRGRSLSVIKILVDAGADLTSKDRQGLTPYRLAVRLGRANVADYFASLNAGEPVDGLEAVLLACASGDVEQARRVAEDVGFASPVTDPHTAALLTSPAERGDVGVLKAMLAVGFPVDGMGFGTPTPLHQACWQGRVEAVRALLQFGASPNIAERQYGATPLGWAVHGSVNRPGARWENHLAIIQLLFAHGATIAATWTDWVEDDALAEPIRSAMLAHWPSV